ncbi:putative viral extrusion protein [Ralstonia phage RSIBR3]|uniref:Viral extrusion protein n=1 Tax=Ralstonia phage RSIBR1 TaxID=2053972 RepID=A0A2H4PMG0_9VIRU|nr:putative viral extrusion protein [Ralstonia phage RSIBR3]ATW64833.1 putative viral extrusion protein [Ralstonia phage RSIBR3]
MRYRKAARSMRVSTGWITRRSQRWPALSWSGSRNCCTRFLKLRCCVGMSWSRTTAWSSWPRRKTSGRMGQRGRCRLIRSRRLRSIATGGLDIRAHVSGSARRRAACIPVWVNRVDQKIVFEKLNARGKDDKYKWTAYKGLHNGTKIKFTQINKGTEGYDPKYFGTYASHQASTENTETYKDARTNVWNNPVLRRWLPLFGAALVVAVWYLWHALKGGGLEQSINAGHKVETKTTVVSAPAPVALPAAASGVQASVSQAQPMASKAEPVSGGQRQDAMADDYVASISQKWRPRLSGLAWAADKARLVVEWYDESNRVKERLSAAQLEEFGWGVARSAYGDHVILSKGGVHVAVTSWPIEEFGRVSDRDNRALHEMAVGKGDGSSSSELPSSMRVPVVPVDARDVSAPDSRQSWSHG